MLEPRGLGHRLLLRSGGLLLSLAQLLVGGRPEDRRPIGAFLDLASRLLLVAAGMRGLLYPRRPANCDEHQGDPGYGSRGEEVPRRHLGMVEDGLSRTCVDRGVL